MSKEVEYIKFLKEYFDPVNKIGYYKNVKYQINDSDNNFYYHNYNNGLPPLKLPKTEENIFYVVEKIEYPKRIK